LPPIVQKIGDAAPACLVRAIADAEEVRDVRDAQGLGEMALVRPPRALWVERTGQADVSRRAGHGVEVRPPVVPQLGEDLQEVADARATCVLRGHADRKVEAYRDAIPIRPVTKSV
jgi:hypothetical protein